jgi:hypothetical protein
VFPVRYELNSYILFRINIVFKGLRQTPEYVRSVIFDKYKCNTIVVIVSVYLKPSYEVYF